MAPIRIIITSETCPMKMRKFQISVKCMAIIWTKFVRGLCNKRAGNGLFFLNIHGIRSLYEIKRV